MKLFPINTVRGAILGVAIAATSSVSAQITTTIDFEGSNPFSAGSLSTDQAASGAQSLFLGSGSAVFDIPVEYQGMDLTVTMDIFDMGKWIDNSVTGHPTNGYGPRWGLSGGDHTPPNSIGGSITHKTFLPSDSGYAIQGADSRFAGSWFGPTSYSGDDRYATLTPGTGGSNDGSGWVAGPGGVGAWMTWTFTVAQDGSTTIHIPGEAAINSKTIGATPSQVWLFGGSGALAGVYVDNVSITAVPEPSTYALLFGVIALGAVAAKRRKTTKASAA